MGSPKSEVGGAPGMAVGTAPDPSKPATPRRARPYSPVTVTVRIVLRHFFGWPRYAG